MNYELATVKTSLDAMIAAWYSWYIGVDGWIVVLVVCGVIVCGLMLCGLIVCGLVVVVGIFGYSKRRPMRAKKRGRLRQLSDSTSQIDTVDAVSQIPEGEVVPRQESDEPEPKASEELIESQTQAVGVAEGVRQALGLFHQRYVGDQSAASADMQQRVQMITQWAMNRLVADQKDAVVFLRDPIVQNYLYKIQCEFASSGRLDLAEMLVETFLDAVVLPRSTLVQVIAADALQGLPKLTISQLNALSLLFLLKYTRNVHNASAIGLQQYAEKYLQMFCADVPRTISSYRHLEYCGCVVIGPSAVSWERLVMDSYPAVFQYLGFTQAEWEAALGGEAAPAELIVLSVVDDKLWKLNAINEELLNERLRQSGLSEPVQQKLHLLQQSRSANCTEEGISRWLPHLHPAWGQLATVWNGTPFEVTKLSVLGIYIAHAHIRKRLGERFDLSIWL